MSYAEWRAHWKTLDWSRKWFAVFLILRPLVDSLYFIKQYSILLSPVYIFGILTPLLAMASAQSIRFKQAPFSRIDTLMKLWGGILVMNALYLMTWAYSLNLLGDEIKYLTPPVVFLYLRRYVRNKEDLRFLMTNFLISCIVPFLMLGFEIFVHPLSPEYVSEGRGGGTRLRGNFADSVSYGLYFIGAFISMGYFFLDRIYSKQKKDAPTLKMLVISLICIVGIAQLRHVATWGVLLVCMVWLMYYNSQNIRGIAIVLLVLLIVLPFFAEPIYNNYISPLIQKEVNVIEGDSDIQYGMNGRVSRWQRYFEIWFRMDPLSQLFGVSFSGFKEAPIMIGGGMHSDYVRILFLTGIIGISIYLLMLGSIFFGWRKLRKPERFLFFSCFSSLVAYSMSTLPMLYLPFINYVFPVLAFVLLPKKRMYSASQPVPQRRPASVVDINPAPAVANGIRA